MAIIKLSEQGATVVAYPALLRARDLVGPDNLYFVVLAENRAVLDLLDVVPERNVLVVRTSSLPLMVLDVLRVVRRLRRAGVDAVVDMELFSRASAILAFLSGASIRVGVRSYFGEGPYTGDLFTHGVRFNPHLPARAVFWQLVAAVESDPEELPALDEVGVPVGLTRPPKVPPTEEERHRAQALLGLSSERHPPVVLLNPNAGDLMPLRKWPGERYVELARRLLDHDPELVVAVTGTEGEAELAGTIVRSIGSERCVDLSGRTTLRELLAVMGESDVLVTNDSGPAHFAGLTGIDSVVLFGPETPAVFAPDDPRSTAVWAGLACSPCISPLNGRRSACADNVCMKRIGVDEVFDAVLAHLEARRGSVREEVSHGSGSPTA